MITAIQSLLKQSVKTIYDVDLMPQITIPDEKFGDLATNVAMQLTKLVGQSPRDIAAQLITVLQNDPVVAQAEIAGPGFINIRLTDTYLMQSSRQKPENIWKAQKIVCEYSCPNWFKELHTGHLYQTVVGDALARLLEQTGATVYRTTFGGDVGQHVARALWSILRDSDGYETAKQTTDPQKRAEFITKHYVAGSLAYEEDDAARDEIRDLNKKIYQLVADESQHQTIGAVYRTCRQWSSDYFHYFYQLLGVTEFDQYYPESSTDSIGLQLVKQGLEAGVFTESEGAVVYQGDQDGLHTRVFITKEGLPTYETKDIGVIMLEKEQFDFDLRILMTGSDQKAYMEVVWSALYKLDAQYKNSMKHLVHGTVKFGDGSKMSSRKGNVTRAIDVFHAVSQKIGGESQPDLSTVLGAIKYEFIRYSIGGDIAFDINESVSTKGNSGPYLQYAHARACSILQKSERTAADVTTLEAGERTLVRTLAGYTSVLSTASREFAPHLICTYLYELAQIFNRFYENNLVIGDDREAVRISLVAQYAQTLKHGLAILGIDAPEHM